MNAREHSPKRDYERMAGSEHDASDGHVRSVGALSRTLPPSARTSGSAFKPFAITALASGR